jgi:hypothetical protein
MSSQAEHYSAENQNDSKQSRMEIRVFTFVVPFEYSGTVVMEAHIGGNPLTDPEPPMCRGGTLKPTRGMRPAVCSIPLPLRLGVTPVAHASLGILARPRAECYHC